LNRTTRIEHEFVELIPEEIREATLYISIPYATATHLCLCGCGQRVITPLTPTDWRLVFDGETVSLEPSIGNWSFKCQSHYIIRRSRVIWAKGFSQEMIDAVRAQDRRAKQRYFGELPTGDEDALTAAPGGRPSGRTNWIRRWLGRLRG
jgi:hypothetical protein